MSQLNIKSWTLTSDWRFAMLAKLYPYDPADGSGFVDRDHALGKLMHGWNAALDLGDTFSETAIALALKQPEQRAKQLLEALEASELGELLRGENGLAEGVRLRGCAERNAWLEEIREKRSRAGAKGGKASGKSRREASKQTRSNHRSKTKQPSNPIVIATATVTATDKDKDIGGSAPVLFPSGVKARDRDSATDAVALDVVSAFNRAFDRKLGVRGFREQVRRLIANGYQPEELKAVVWWAAREWAEDPDWRMRISPTTLFKLQSSQGNRTFPQYLELASERWRDEHSGEPPPWEVAPAHGNGVSP